MLVPAMLPVKSPGAGTRYVLPDKPLGIEGISTSAAECGKLPVPSIMPVY